MYLAGHGNNSIFKADECLFSNSKPIETSDITDVKSAAFQTELELSKWNLIISLKYKHWAGKYQAYYKNRIGHFTKQ